ncbi:hypothetical protein V8B97DRAFT_2026060 [Scleroderma yunnanense]
MVKFPTSIQNITLSFEPKSQGPMTIEINLTTTLPELTFIANSFDTTIINCTTTSLSASRVKLKPADTSMCITPVIDDSVTEPESQAAMPTVVKNTIPIYVPPTQVPHPTFRHSFTPDSFARLETFKSISTQLITERWAQIQAGLIMGQENNKSSPTPPPKLRSYCLPTCPPLLQCPSTHPHPLLAFYIMMGFWQCHCKTHGCCGALVSAHTLQSQLYVGLISQTFPFPVYIAFLNPPHFSPSPFKQEMLNHSTLTGEDINILTFDSALLNLRPNFHSLEVLLSAVNYFQEYNTRTSVGGQPLTPFIAHHLPLDPEQHALECQLQQIMEEVHGPPPDQNTNNIPHEMEDKDDPDLYPCIPSPAHCLQCAVFTLLLLFLNPNITAPFTTLQSGNHLLGVNKPIHTLPVCPTYCDVYPPATSLLCHDTCMSYQTLHENACAAKTPITSILKIPGMEKPHKPGMYMGIFDGPDAKLFFLNNTNKWHGPNGEL